MRLQSAEILKLLPAWMRNDEAVQGLAAGTDELTRSIAARIRLLSRWDKIDQLTEAELDEMAWELNIKWYKDTASIQTKRELIRNSDRVYATLGTRYAVEQIVQDYFGAGDVIEWFDYDGKPYHFKVQTGNPALVNANLDLFVDLLQIVKRRSSWLDAIMVRLAAALNLHAGVTITEHTAETHVFTTTQEE